MITIGKLQWYNYDKPCFCSFRGEGKEHRGDIKEKLVRKRGRRRNKKTSPVLGPALIQPAEGSRSWSTPPLQQFFCFYRQLASSL